MKSDFEDSPQPGNTAGAQSRHFEALHLLGVIAAQTKNPQQAMALIDKAIAINPRNADAHNNRGNVLQMLGRFNEALASYDQALTFKADAAEAHWNLSWLVRQVAKHA